MITKPDGHYHTDWPYPCYCKCRKLLDEKDEKIKKLREALKNIIIVNLNPDWGQIVSSEHYEGAWLDCADIAKAALQETSDQERGKVNEKN